jgi:ATP-dependent DNA ligase
LTGPGWIFELKYDGFRLLAAHRGGRAELVSRRGNDFADRFPEIASELVALPELVLDSELVLLDQHDHALFDQLSWRSRLKRPMSIEHAARTEPAVVFAFDLLELKGRDVRSWPLLDRKALLTRTLARSNQIRCTNHVDDGAGLLRPPTPCASRGSSRSAQTHRIAAGAPATGSRSRHATAVPLMCRVPPRRSKRVC